MKKLLLLLILFTMPAFAGSYGVYTPDNYSADDVQEDERILFILDFSNSMS